MRIRFPLLVVACAANLQPDMSSMALDFNAALAAAKKEARLVRERSKQQPPRDGGARPLPNAPPLPDAPAAVRYAPDAVTKAEALALADGVRALDGWAALPQRRLLSCGGTPHPDGAWAEPLPECLRALALRVAPLFGGAIPDQALVNEYDAGGGIDAHRDGPLYEPRAVVVSLESSAALDFYDDRGARVGAVLLRPRSLVAFDGAAYEAHDHGIAPATEDAIDARIWNAAAAAVADGDVVRRAPKRLSITFRRLRHVARRFDAVGLELLSDNDRSELARRRAWWASSIAEK